MESSEPSSCDISSVTSDSSVIFRPPAAPMDSSKMSLAPPRADREVKMIEEAASSMLSVFDHFRHRLTEAQYAYYCQYGSSCLNEAMDKKLRKVNRTYMDSTLNRVETASMAGSMRSLSTVPLYDIYSSNIPSAQLPMYARPPTFAPSVVSDYPRQPAFGSIPQRLMHSGHSSGYSSNGVDSHNRTYLASMSNPQSNLQRQQPVSSRRQNGTLVQALNESVAVSSSPEPKVRPNPHRRARAESEHRHPDRRRRSPSPASSQSSVSVPDQTQEKAKKSTIAVPKRQKGVVELKNWSIKLVGEELCVTGFTHDKSQVTSGSVTRYSYPTIVTTKGSFLVIGEPGHGERKSWINSS
ncbi:hypothetical protein GE061_018377 [Apolygus lucorum]|uniref:Uncharacterized protein n=1 Tax=Apolygus lucorum TaxID=248454 RepID=A0A8S9XFU7_APOLU|nr:hypothetical protein GE061_018377 [Apolygus lucorum]